MKLKFLSSSNDEPDQESRRVEPTLNGKSNKRSSLRKLFKRKSSKSPKRRSVNEPEKYVAPLLLDPLPREGLQDIKEESSEITSDPIKPRSSSLLSGRFDDEAHIDSDNDSVYLDQKDDHEDSEDEETEDPKVSKAVDMREEFGDQKSLKENISKDESPEIDQQKDGSDEADDKRSSFANWMLGHGSDKSIEAPPPEAKSNSPASKSEPNTTTPVDGVDAEKDNKEASNGQNEEQKKSIGTDQSKEQAKKVDTEQIDGRDNIEENHSEESTDDESSESSGSAEEESHEQRNEETVDAPTEKPSMFRRLSTMGSITSFLRNSILVRHNDAQDQREQVDDIVNQTSEMEMIVAKFGAGNYDSSAEFSMSKGQIEQDTSSAQEQVELSWFDKKKIAITRFIVKAEITLTPTIVRTLPREIVQFFSNLKAEMGARNFLLMCLLIICITIGLPFFASYTRHHAACAAQIPYRQRHWGSWWDFQMRKDRVPSFCS